MRGPLCVFFFFFLAALCSLRDLSSPTRDWTWALEVKAPIPNHWTLREFPVCILFLILKAAPVDIIIFPIFKWRNWGKFLSPKCGESWNVKVGWWGTSVITRAASSYSLGLDRPSEGRGWLAPGSWGCAAGAGSTACSAELEPRRRCSTAGGQGGPWEKYLGVCFPPPVSCRGKGAWETYVGNGSESK